MKSFFLDQFKFAGYLLLIVILITFVIIALAYLVSFSSSDNEKLSSYECGFNPYDDARNVFDIHFYLVCILFIVFDLETVFFLPWVITLQSTSLESFFLMVDFIFELFIGYLYAYYTGALNWKFLTQKI